MRKYSWLQTGNAAYLIERLKNRGLSRYLVRVLPVQRRACGHAASKASDACVLKVRDAEDVVGYHSHGVRRGDEEAVLTQDHAAVLERNHRQSFEIKFRSSEHNWPLAIV